MARVLSGLALAAAAFALVWFLPWNALLVVAMAVAALAFVEYARLAQAVGAPLPWLASLVTTLAACMVVTTPWLYLPSLLAVGLLVIAVTAMAGGQHGPPLFNGAAAGMLAPLYIGLPLGALVGIHQVAGREGVLAIIATVAASDTFQFYTGRTFGRRPLAPTISPKKTIEGAIGGLVLAPLALVAIAYAWLPAPDAGGGVGRRGGHRDCRHRRRPVRVGAQARRRREGQRHADSRPRRRPRPHRRAALRRADLLPGAAPRMTRVAILGATGSIGTSALAVAEAHPDRVRVVGLAAGQNVAPMAAAVRRHRPLAVSMSSAEALSRLASTAGGLPPIAGVGAEGLVAVATHPEVDVVLCASSGTAGLEAVLAAIDAGKTIALANKEVLVMAGGLVMDRGPRPRRADPAGRQRAQRHPPVPARPSPGRCPPAHPDRVRRAVSRPHAGPASPR